MPVISSHILDSITGTSAIGIRVQLFRLNSHSQAELVFDLISDDEGRISEKIDLDSEQMFELVFHSKAYFKNTFANLNASQNMSTVVTRFTMKNKAERYHIPLVLSPHSYTLWWSK